MKDIFARRVAAHELVSRRDDAGVALRDGRLYGTALMVIDGIDADSLLVPLDGGRSLALVDARAEGVASTPLRTIDRTRGFSEVVFEAAPVGEWIGEPGAAAAACGRMLDAARVALAADILGASQRAIELAVAYAMQRRQFDRVIGSFQAVKHLCAEMVAELEPARSLVWYAAHAFDRLRDRSARHAALAKAHLCDLYDRATRVATELHGGIGFTWEYDLHLWFRRAMFDRSVLGSATYQRARAAAAAGW